MRRAFVTGGTGFIGRNLIEQLVHQDFAVTALHRAGSDVSGLKAYPVDLKQGDLLDADSLKRAIAPDTEYVFHVAGDTSMWARHALRQAHVNIDGTANMLAAAEARGVRRFVHTSTWNVYGLEQGRINEGSPRRGGNSWVAYHRTKYAGEYLVRDAARRLETVILNPAHVIGRYDAHGWSRIIRMVHDGKLIGAPPGSGSFAHAEAVALAHIAAAERGKVGANYLLGGADASFLQLVQVIGEITGAKVPGKPLPAWTVKTVARLKAWRATVTGIEPDVTPEAAEMLLMNPRIDSNKAERDLDYRTTSLRIMLLDCYRWMRDAGLLK